MQINLTKRIVILTMAMYSYNIVDAQSWSKSFTAGSYDSNKKLLGGSEVLQLVDHKNILFASVGYWEDANNIWYGGSNSNIGWGQVNRLDNPSANWQEDLFLGASFLRPEILKQIIFTKDQFGSSLSSPDTVLICAGYSPNYITRQVIVKSFVRNDVNGTWGESQIVQGSFPEVANSALHFSSGSKLYRRIDGVSPSYVIDHDFSDLGATINSAVGGIRGLTTIDNPSGIDDAFLLMWCPNGQSQGTIYRLEPDGSGGFNRIYEAKLSILIERFLVGSNASYVLGAYNEFYKYIEPISNDTIHLVGFEVNITGGGHPTWNGYYKGGLFAKRNSNSQYSIEEINGTIGTNDTALVANRCYVSSPFSTENALYFGGFDPNSNSSTNMAWVFKNTYHVNAVDDLAKNENNFVIYPNPSSNQLFIKRKNFEEFEFDIINLLGKKVASGKINGQTKTVDISSLPPNIYILRIDSEAVKFVKVN